MSTQLQHDFAKLGPEFSSRVLPSPLRKPSLIHINTPLAHEINAETLLSDQKAFLKWASGQELLGPEPLAMNYSGHQFGVFNPELGDGRGLLLGEWADKKNILWDFHLKGAGRTPYSRFGDGRAVLRSSIREYLVGESLHALGIPSSRSLCLLGSDEVVMREQEETAATIIRTSQSHIRFGSFEQFFYQRQYPQLRQLADYCIERYCPKPNGDPYAALLHMAVDNTAKMIGLWQVYGFNHGVMNTDNMSIIGDTFDFGPYAFLDDYEPDFICNHSDSQGRYSFSQQPGIGLWNLNALAHALSPLLDRDQIKSALMRYQPQLAETFQHGLNNRLGLNSANADEHESNVRLGQQWLSLLAQAGLDYTLSFRQLSEWHRSGQWPEPLASLQEQEGFDAWCQEYQDRQRDQNSEQIAVLMDQHNPLYIPRSHLLQQVIEDAQNGQYQSLNTLFECIRQPFSAQKGCEIYAQAPKTDQKGISLSCSS